MLSTAEPAFYDHFELRGNMAIKVGLPDNKVFFLVIEHRNQWFKRASVMIYLHLQFPVADPAVGWGGVRNMKSMRPPLVAIFF